MPKWAVALLAVLAVFVVVAIMFIPDDSNNDSPQQKPSVAKAPNTSLFRASMDGNIEVVRQHLAAGSDVNEKFYKGRTSLFNAVQKGHKEIAELLIDSGANVNVKGEEGVTPLHFAALFGRPETAKLLIAKGAGVNIKDNKNETPLDNLIISKILPQEIQARFKETYDILRAHGAKTTENKNASGIPNTQRHADVIPKELLAYVRDQNIELIFKDK